MTKIKITKSTQTTVKIKNQLLVERREKQKAKQKNKIIKTAKTIIFAGGNPTVRKLTNSIKYSIPVFFSHFKTKAKLIEELENDIKIKYPDYDSLFEAYKQILSR